MHYMHGKQIFFDYYADPFVQLLLLKSSTVHPNLELKITALSLTATRKHLSLETRKDGSSEAIVAALFHTKLEKGFCHIYLPSFVRVFLTKLIVSHGCYLVAYA